MPARILNLLDSENPGSPKSQGVPFTWRTLLLINQRFLKLWCPILPFVQGRCSKKGQGFLDVQASQEAVVSSATSPDDSHIKLHSHAPRGQVKRGFHHLLALVVARCRVHKASTASDDMEIRQRALSGRF